MIDGEVPETVDVKQLLPRLDSVVLRAALAAQKIVRSEGNYLMLDPAGARLDTATWTGSCFDVRP